MAFPIHTEAEHGLADLVEGGLEAAKLLAVGVEDGLASVFVNGYPADVHVEDRRNFPHGRGEGFLDVLGLFLELGSQLLLDLERQATIQPVIDPGTLVLRQSKFRCQVGCVEYTHRRALSQCKGWEGC